MQKTLRDGLILRSLSEGVQSDKDNLAEFYVQVFKEAGDEDTPSMRLWVEDLIADEHPTMALDDIWVVVDPAHNDKIVSALLLIPQTWRYEDVELGVGRVELVATDKNYRRKGLIRELMNVAHERSESLGHHMQGITGIPYYYRRFGYSMTVNLGGLGSIPFTSIKPLKDDEKPAFTIRDATSDDAENLVRWDALLADRALLSTVRSAADWRYELSGRTVGSVFEMRVGIIVNAEGEDVGYVAMQTSQDVPQAFLLSYAVDEKASYLATFDDVMRWCKAQRDKDYPADGDVEVPVHLGFASDVAPEVLKILRYSAYSVVRDFTYAWYMRVNDKARFIKHIAPVLERRLVGSAANRFTGELKVGSYDFTGVVITFENGKITDVVNKKDMDIDNADVSFPYDLFLNVLLGHHRRRDLMRYFPEVGTGSREGKAGILLDVLFPVKPSSLLALA